MTPSKSQKQVRIFIGLVNYCRDMWAKRSYLLHYLTELTSNKVKFKWTDVEQKSIYEIKRIIACDNLLTQERFIRNAPPALHYFYQFLIDYINVYLLQNFFDDTS